MGDRANLARRKIADWSWGWGSEAPSSFTVMNSFSGSYFPTSQGLGMRNSVERRARAAGRPPAFAMRHDLVVPWTDG